MKEPTLDVLDAFGIKGKLVSLPEGRGLCYLADGVVLKPSDDDDESQFIAEVSSSLAASRSTDYRVSTPMQVRDDPGSFVYKGWTAWSRLTGETEPAANFEKMLLASRQFHKDLAAVCSDKPSILSKAQNRWTKADGVVWDEQRLEDVETVNCEIFASVEPYLERIKALKIPFDTILASQLIHGDLTGNFLFDPDPATPPAIIDLTFYWRPALYADAIIVTDGILWWNQGIELIEYFAIDESRTQLLVRALYWRILTFAIDSEVEWVREHLPRVDLDGCVTNMEHFMGKQAAI